MSEKIAEKLRETAAKLLEGKSVDLVIGFGAGTDPYRTTPVFINRPEEAGLLVWNPFCENNLAKYLVDYKNLQGKVAVVVKGCDSRAINRLVQDGQINRERVVALGVPCTGLLKRQKAAEAIGYNDRITLFEHSDAGYQVKTGQGEFFFDKKDAFLDKCLSCEAPNPVVADEMLGEEVRTHAVLDRFAAVQVIEQLPSEEKSDYWDRQFTRCLRCYACRNVCTVCTCRECIFDMADPGWVSKRTNLSENTAFHLIRAFHVAGRCVDCGECERVCPVNIPLGRLNRKILKDIKELFDAPTPGASLDLPPALGWFKADDPEKL